MNGGKREEAAAFGAESRRREMRVYIERERYCGVRNLHVEPRGRDGSGPIASKATISYSLQQKSSQSAALRGANLSK